MVADIDPTVADTAQAIGAAGGDGFAFTADLTQPDAVTTLAREVGTKMGGLDILINNAGIAIPPARLLDVSVEDWDWVIAANLRSVFLVSKAMLPLLLRSAHASMVNISSFLGLVGAYPGFPVTAVPYAASKAGIDGFTRQVALEYAKDGLRVNAVAPGWHGGTRLGRVRRTTALPEALDRHETYLAGSIPMGRRGTPDELTGLVIYLASSASHYVTGQVFAHDGGLTAT